MKRLIPLVLLIAAAVGYYFYTLPPTHLRLTGIVTTHDVAVAPQIGGRLVKLSVKEGDAVTKGQTVAEIDPGELAAESAYYQHSAEGVASQIQEGEAAIRFQEKQLEDQIKQAEASIAAVVAQQSGAAADLERAKLTLDRTKELSKSGLAPPQQLDEARTAYDAAQSRADALARQADASRAALQLARSNAEQVAIRRSQVETTQHQLAAVGSQKAKADMRLSFAKVASPIDGFVDVQPAREGEVVQMGQTIITLIDPDDLWVRADIEETYIDRVKNGDTLDVELPSGEKRTATVFYRRADAGFATQRDVSRTKRDIKTFETRLRIDNKDRKLAVGMTVYVLLPL